MKNKHGRSESKSDGSMSFASKSKTPISYLSIILSIFILISLVSGCSITGRAVQDFKDDDKLFAEGIKNNDISKCRMIQYSIKSEECLVSVAKDKKDVDVCYFIKDMKVREACVGWIERSIR